MVKCTKGRVLAGQGGASMVEFSIVAIVFFLLVFGVFDFGRGIFYYNMISNAAREGARYGVIDMRDETAICEVAAGATSLPGVPYPVGGCGTAGLLTVTAVDGTQSTMSNGVRQFGQPTLVTVQYEFQPITPLIANLVVDPNTGTLRLTASASMYVED